MEDAVQGSEACAAARRTVSVPIKVLAFLHIALALAGLVAGMFACVSFWLIPGRFSNTVLAFAIPIFLFFVIFLFLPGLAGGVALLLGKAWGRIIIFLLSGLMLFVVPIGTVLGGFGLWVLLSDPGARIPAEPAGKGAPTVTGAYLAATLLILVAAGAAGIILLEIVFRFQEQDAPPPIADAFPGATIALPAALILAALIIGLSRWRRRSTGPISDGRA